MKKRFQVKNFYATTLSAPVVITPWVDGQILVDEYPSISNWKEFFIIFNPLDESSRFVLRAYMDAWDVLYKWEYITEATSFEAQSAVQINDVAEMFNTIYDNVDDFGECTDIGWLSILVNWGLIKYNDTYVELSDQVLAMTDNATNYVVFDFTTGTTVKVTSLTWLNGILLYSVVTSGGDIISTTDKRSTVLGYGIDDTYFEFENGKLTVKNNILSYNHTQSSSSATRVINHWLNTKNLVISVFDASDNKLDYTDIEFNTDNQITLTLWSANTGRVTIISAWSLWYDQYLNAYDCIVAPTGGNYTSVATAIAAGKRRILVKNGTYNNEWSWRIAGTTFWLIVHAETPWGVIINFNNTATIINASSGEVYGCTLNFAFNPASVNYFYNSNDTSLGAMQFRNCKINGTVSGTFTQDIYLVEWTQQTSFNDCEINISGTLTAAYKLIMWNDYIIYNNCKLNLWWVQTRHWCMYNYCFITGLSIEWSFNELIAVWSYISMQDNKIFSSSVSWFLTNSIVNIPVGCSWTMNINRCVWSQIDANSSAVILDLDSVTACAWNEFYSFASITVGDWCVSWCILRVKPWGNIIFSDNYWQISWCQIYCDWDMLFNAIGCSITWSTIAWAPYIIMNWDDNVLSGCTTPWGAYIPTVARVTGWEYNIVTSNARIDQTWTIWTNVFANNT